MGSFVGLGDWYEFSAEKPGARYSFFYLPYHILGKTFSEIYDNSSVYAEIYGEYHSSLSDCFFYHFCVGLSVNEILRLGKVGYRASSAVYRSLDQDLHTIGFWLSNYSGFSEFNSLLSQICALLVSKYDSLPVKPSTRAEWGKFKTKCTNELKPFVRESLEKILPAFCAKWSGQT